MNKDELTELVGRIKPFLKDYLAETGREAKRGGFIHCPNPSHEDKHPSASYDPKRLIVHCFACGANYDLINLYALDKGISKGEAIKRLAAKYLGESYKPQEAPATGRRGAEDLEQILAAKETAPAISYLKRRGFKNPEAVANLAQIKGDQLFIYFPHRHLIETQDGGAEAKITDWQRRAIIDKPDPEDPAKIDKAKRYSHKGRVSLFDPLQVFKFDYGGALAVVCEGEIDALSVYDLKAGEEGSELKALQALALSGVNNYRLLSEELDKAENKPKGFIICFDDDKAGREAARETAKILESRGLPYVLAQLPEGCHDLNEALKEKRADLFALAKSWAQDFEALAKGQKTQAEADREEYQSRNGARNALNALFRAINSQEGKIPLKTNFEGLDGILGGAIKPGIMTIGALSSMGKTTFILQMADQIATEGARDVLYFSLEQDLTELAAKSLSRLTFQLCFNDPSEAQTLARTEADIEQAHRYRTYTSAQKSRIWEAGNIYQALAERLYLVAPDPNLERYTAGDIAAAVKEHIAKTGNRPVVFVDYLQYLDGFTDRETDRQALDHNFKVLRSLAKAEGLLIVLLSSINRSSYNAAIDQASFKESGKIEYSSDYLLALDLTAFKTGGEAAKFDPLKDSQSIKQAIEKGKTQDPRAITLTLLKARGGEVYRRADFHYYARYNCFIELKDAKEYKEPLKKLIEKAKNKADKDLPF